MVRHLTTLLCIVALLGMMTGASLASAPVVVESTFDKGKEGWTKRVPHEKHAELRWVRYEDRSGGYLMYIDRNLDDRHDHSVGDYFNAPEKFLGEKVAYYNGKLKFDMRLQRVPRSASGDNLVQIHGAGATLVYKVFGRQRPTDVWDTMIVPLQADQWFIGLSDEHPSEALMKAVLADLQMLAISADWLPGEERTFLDNVRLIPPHLVDK